MTEPDRGPGVGELSRQVRDVFLRFEGLATRLENQFVRNDNFQLYKQLVDQALLNLQELVKTKASDTELSELRSRVKDLEEARTWLVRLVIGFVVLSILGLVWAVSKSGGA